MKAIKRPIIQARNISEDRAAWSEAQALIQTSQEQILILQDRPILQEAEELAQAEKFAEAVELAQQIERDRPLYDEAREAISRFREQWSRFEDRPILDEAIEYAENGQLTDAIATAAQIAPGRPLYFEAQAEIGRWLRERDQGGSSSRARSSSPAPAQASTPASTPASAPASAPAPQHQPPSQPQHQPQHQPLNPITLPNQPPNPITLPNQPPNPITLPSLTMRSPNPTNPTYLTKKLSTKPLSFSSGSVDMTTVLGGCRQPAML